MARLLGVCAGYVGLAGWTRCACWLPLRSRSLCPKKMRFRLSALGPGGASEPRVGVTVPKPPPLYIRLACCVAARIGLGNNGGFVDVRRDYLALRD